MPNVNVPEETVNNQVYTNYDSMAIVQYCTPSFVGCKVCINVGVESGYVALTIQASTPFGSYSKTFKITNNISFTWQPLSVFKVALKITNFSNPSHSFSFDASIQGCLKVPFFGWKCSSYNHHFSVPTAIPATHQELLKGKEIDDKDYSALLAMHTLVTENQNCNCH